MIYNDDIANKKELEDFTPDEIAAANAARAKYVRERSKQKQHEKQIAQLRYWLRKARESE